MAVLHSNYLGLCSEPYLNEEGFYLAQLTHYQKMASVRSILKAMHRCRNFNSSHSQQCLLQLKSCRKDIYLEDFKISCYSQYFKQIVVGYQDYQVFLKAVSVVQRITQHSYLIKLLVKYLNESSGIHSDANKKKMAAIISLS